MNTPDRYGQIPANMNNANQQLRNLQYAVRNYLKKKTL